MKFYSELMRYYDNVFPLSPMKVTWLKAFVKAHGTLSLLDVGCATGALCGAMTGLVPRVNGFDLDEAMIHKAMNQYPGCKAVFTVGNMLDMSDLFQGSTYDLVTCFGNTLVHLPPDDLEKALEQIKIKLKAGGWFIGQILNYDTILDGPVKELPLIDNATIRFDRRYQWDESSQLDFKTKLTVKDSGEVYDNVIQLYPIRRHVLEGLLKCTGFKEINFYKDYKGTLAEGTHLPLIFTAKI